MDEHRTRRVSDAVKDELSELIGFEMDDPRVAGVTITTAEVTTDMRHAKVRIAVDAAEEKQAMKALEHAKNFLRHELASRLDLRRVPELHFSVDAHPDADERIEILLKRAARTRARG